MLTGQCKNDFKKWYNENIYACSKMCMECGGNISINGFLNIPLSFQYGVFVNFFRQAKNKEATQHIVYDFFENICIGLTTEEAIKDAVKNADEVYNKN